MPRLRRRYRLDNGSWSDHNDLDDLYPPDAEHVTKADKERAFRSAIGAALIVWGTGFIFHRAVGLDPNTFWLGLGAGALASWGQVRRYGWFVAGALMTAIGVGDFFDMFLNGAYESSLSCLLIAAGFLAIYARYPHRSTWAAVPGVIFAVIAAAIFGAGLIGTVAGALGGLLLPGLVVATGVLLLNRNRLPQPIGKIGVIACVVAFAVVGMSSLGRSNPKVFIREVVANGESESWVPGDKLPATDGRTVMLQLESSADVNIEPGERFAIARSDSDNRYTVTASADQPILLVEDKDERGDDDYDVTVPRGTNLVVMVTSGGINAETDGGSVKLVSTSGDIDLKVLGHGTDPTQALYSVTATRGSVDVESDVPLTLDITCTRGDLNVPGEDPDGCRHSTEGTAPRLRVVTTSGDISVDAPEAKAA